jgi:hypothetical protein
MVYTKPVYFKDSTFFVKNSSIMDNRMVIFQKCESIERALYVANEWRKQKINVENQESKDRILEQDTVDFVVYTQSEENDDLFDENVITDGKTDYFLSLVVYKFENVDKQIYYAILPY